MFKESNTPRFLISMIVVVTMVVTSIFVSFDSNMVSADTSVDKSEKIEELTDDPDSKAEYDGFIVKMKDNKTGKVDEGELDDFDSTPDNKYVMVDAPEDALEFVDPSYIDCIEPNYIRHTFGETTVVKGVTSTYYNKYSFGHVINVNGAWANGFNGSGTTVAVLDTGLSNNHAAVPNSIVRSRYNFLGRYGTSWQLAPNTNVRDDYKYGHGTPVTGLIAANGSDPISGEQSLQGVAYESKIIVGKIMGSKGEGSVGDFIQAVYTLANRDVPDILNMSFGGTDYSSMEYSVLKTLTDKGTIAIAACGNEGMTGSPQNYPANYENVIGVGSVDDNKNVSSFSNKNSSVLVAAPGNGVMSTANYAGGYLSCEGTSFSSPIVAGAAALVYGKIKGSTAAQKKNSQNRFLTLIKNTSQGGGTYNINTGYGVLDVNKLTLAANSSGVNTKKSYQISYQIGGGYFSGPISTIHTEGTTTTLPRNVNKKGYNFSHWINEYGAKVSAISASYQASGNDDGNMTLTAVWSPKKYKLKFKGNGGKVKAKTKTVKYQRAVGKLKAPKKRSGYNFLGWYTKKKGGTEYYKGKKYKRTKGLTLYAHWTKKNVAKFNANGGTVKKYAKKISANKKFGSLPKPKRSGYKFKGWYTKKKGGTKITKGSTAKGKNYTLYAHWKKKK